MSATGAGPTDPGALAVYAMGAGLGHLTRVAAAVHTLGIDPDRVTIVTDSVHATDPAVTGRVRLEPATPAEAVAALHRLHPAELWVDAFPAGLAGELRASTLPASVTVTRHLARRLRWDTYRATLDGGGDGNDGRGGDQLVFDHTSVLEPLDPAHTAHLEAISRHLSPLDLRDPPASVPHDLVTAFEVLPPPRWLVAHAGPAAETEELARYARDMAATEGVTPSIVVVTPSGEPVPDLPVVVVRGYPVWPLFDRADRIITAAGFNAMRQGRAHAPRHRFVPFARRFDDQFARARNARSWTSPA